MKIKILNFISPKNFKFIGENNNPNPVVSVDLPNRTIEFLEDDLTVPEIEYRKLSVFLELLEEKIETPDQVPGLPTQVPDSIWIGLIVPALEIRGAILKKDLKPGIKYLGECRNSETAIWKGDEFEYIRTKFGYSYPETINHFEDDDGYDLFVPIKELPED